MRTAALILVIACVGYTTGLFNLPKSSNVVEGLGKIQDGIKDMLPSLDLGAAPAPAPTPTNSTTNSTAPAPAPPPAPAINDTVSAVPVPTANLTDAVANLTSSTDTAAVPTANLTQPVTDLASNGTEAAPAP